MIWRVWCTIALLNEARKALCGFREGCCHGPLAGALLIRTHRSGNARSSVDGWRQIQSLSHCRPKFIGITHVSLAGLESSARRGPANCANNRVRVCGRQWLMQVSCATTGHRAKFGRNATPKPALFRVDARRALWCPTQRWARAAIAGRPCRLDLDRLDRTEAVGCSRQPKDGELALEPDPAYDETVSTVMVRLMSSNWPNAGRRA